MANELQKPSPGNSIFYFHYNPFTPECVIKYNFESISSFSKLYKYQKTGIDKWAHKIPEILANEMNIENHYIMFFGAIADYLFFVDQINRNANQKVKITCTYYTVNQKEYFFNYEKYLPLAQANDKNALDYIGVMFQFGYGIDQNLTEAMTWLNKAADLDQYDAQYHLGCLYYHSHLFNDNHRAFYWFTKAAENQHCYAFKYLGEMYYQGLGVLQNSEKSFEYYQKAAFIEDSEVWRQIAGMYLNGIGTIKNLTEAAKWYEKAAELDCKESQYNLAVLNEDGAGIPKNEEVAAKWYLRAAEQEYAPAQCNLGCMYYDGRGVPKNEDLAKYWLTKAANQGLAIAQENLNKLVPPFSTANSPEMENEPWTAIQNKYATAEKTALLSLNELRDFFYQFTIQFETVKKCTVTIENIQEYHWEHNFLIEVSLLNSADEIIYTATDQKPCLKYVASIELNQELLELLDHKKQITFSIMLNDSEV